MYSYCECFRYGQQCDPSCHCRDCLNKSEFQARRVEAMESALAKKSHAFQMNFVAAATAAVAAPADAAPATPFSPAASTPRSTPGHSPMKAPLSGAASGAASVGEGTLLAVPHRKGCHCKKSQCLKK